MDNTTLFAAGMICSAGLLMRWFDKLSAERKDQRAEAMMHRVMWGTKRR